MVKPPEPVADLDFFDRSMAAKLFRDMAGSTGPDDDFWEGLGKGSMEEKVTFYFLVFVGACHEAAD
jgi:hypothetical protein